MIFKHKKTGWLIEAIKWTGTNNSYCVISRKMKKHGVDCTHDGVFGWLSKGAFRRSIKIGEWVWFSVEDSKPSFLWTKKERGFNLGNFEKVSKLKIKKNELDS